MKRLTALFLVIASTCAQGSSGIIRGTLTSANGTPISTGSVQIFDGFGKLVASASPDISGIYVAPFSWSGSPFGSFFVRTDSTGYVDELFNGYPCPAGNCVVTSGTSLVVQNGGSAYADFQLSNAVIFADGFDP
jgi:hypothetical protein